MKIGYIGLGLMGGPIAVNIAKSGAEVLVNDTNPERVDAVVACGAKAASNKEIAENCDIVAMILPSPNAVMNVIFGDDGIAKHMKKGALIVDQSSVSPQTSKECQQRLEQYGIHFMDAPVSGGSKAVKTQGIAIMCGGSQEDFDLANEKIFRHIGNKATLVGGVGSGNICKLANQIMVCNNTATVAEALTFAKKAGADPEKVYQAIRSGAAGSFMLDLEAPRMLSREFEPGGSITVILKDIGNVLSMAQAVDAVVPNTTHLYEILKSLRNNGYSEKDIGVVVRYYEEMTGITVG